MFRRILVPLDGSDRAEQAVPVAARIARAAHGTLVLLQVTELPGNFFMEGAYLSQIYTEDLLEQGKAGASIYLDGIGKRPELAGLATEMRVGYGDVAQSLLDAIEPLDVDLIAMCSHGYRGLKRLALGSVAQKIVMHSPVPVLVLRDGGSRLAAKPVCALVALDGSPLSEEVLAPATQLVAALAPSAQKTLHLVRVVNLPPSYGRAGWYLHADQMRDEAKRLSQAYLAAVAERIARDGVTDLTVTTSVAVNVDVGEALVQVAEQVLNTGGQFDLLAMATHGRSGLSRLVMGSVSLKRSGVPALCPARSTLLDGVELWHGRAYKLSASWGLQLFDALRCS
jgi:nucleotide-binding universal stress UspA family protein